MMGERVRVAGPGSVAPGRGHSLSPMTDGPEAGAWTVSPFAVVGLSSLLDTDIRPPSGIILDAAGTDSHLMFTSSLS